MERLNWNLQNTAMATSFDRAAYEQWRVDTYNASQGTLTDYDCPKCKNRGNFARLREDLTHVYIPCDCMNTRSSLQRLAKSGLSPCIDQYTFQSFEASEGWMTLLKEGAMAYARSGEGWMMISGRSGIGKTHLCTAVCRERILQGQQVRYMSWREEIRQLKSPDTQDALRQDLLQELKTVPVLYIDDLFKTGAGPEGRAQPTPADVNLAFEILNYRYINHLSTILSTELTLDQLMRIDEAIASRILERCGNHAYVVDHRKSRNYRLTKQHYVG